MFKKSLYIVGAAIALMLIGLVSFPATGIAEDCSMQGSWYGFNPDGNLEWVLNAQGQSHSSGTFNLEDPTIDPKAGDPSSPAVRITDFRGLWKKSGRNTFDWTTITIAVAADGTPVWTGKMSGTSTLMKGCDELIVEATFEIFLPNQDPFKDTSIFQEQLPVFNGYRMRVDPPFSF